MYVQNISGMYSISIKRQAGGGRISDLTDDAFYGCGYIPSPVADAIRLFVLWLPFDALTIEVPDGSVHPVQIVVIDVPTGG